MAVTYQVSACHYDDLFFHPSVCHVCKYISKTGMIRCDCGMLSYCSEEHMAIDRKGTEDNVGHGEICNIIKRLLRNKWLLRFSGGEHHEWIKRKYRYINIVQKKLRREIMPHEQRMLLFARFCWVCSKNTQLKTCNECYSIDYCNEHDPEISRRNMANGHPCQQLKRWLFFEIKATNINPIPQWRTFHNFPNKGNVRDMYAFFKEYVVHVKPEGMNWLDLIYSDYLSWPLTTYDVIRRMKLLDHVRTKDTYVIHIVEASNMDKLYLPSWEVFLHVFCKPLQLIVVMIGTDLASDLASTRGKFQTCREKCIPLGHELYFEYHRMSYYEYVWSELHQQPDIILGYQVNGYNHKTFSQFVLESLQSPYCPIILTANSKLYAEMLRNKMKPFINKVDKQPVVKHNKFKSYRPYRDHIDGCIYYRNEYMIILYNLDL